MRVGKFIFFKNLIYFDLKHWFYDNLNKSGLVVFAIALASFKGNKNTDGHFFKPLFGLRGLQNKQFR